MASRFVGSLLILLPALYGGAVPNRYIVELAEDSGWLSLKGSSPGQRREAVQTARRQAHAHHAAVARRVEAAGGRVLDCADLVANALFVEIADEGARELLAIPGVTGLSPVHEFRSLLDEAAKVQRVNPVWEILGRQEAGRNTLIGIIDTGIATAHPAFQDSTLPVPNGYPLAGTDSDLAFTNNKIIVARSYVRLLPFPDDPSAADNSGHGTGAAMIAAGAAVGSEMGLLRGIAPAAYLASYKVFGTPGINNLTVSDAVIKAIDDAVADGVSVLYVGVGSEEGPFPVDHPTVQAVERASAMGVVVVCPAGNSGPSPGTVGHPGTAPSAITVGAAYNSRLLAAEVSAGGPLTFPAAAVPSTVQADVLSGPLADVVVHDSLGYGCSSFPPGVMAGKIVLVELGGCLVEDKAANLARASALAVVIYADLAEKSPLFRRLTLAPSEPLPVPVLIVDYPHGIMLKQALAREAEVRVRLRLEPRLWTTDTGQVASFSGRGPTTDGRLKPDLVAVGMQVYTATQTNNPASDLYSPSGYRPMQGTSFSGPMVAGAAAVLISAFPGFEVADYRSFLINTATPVVVQPNQAARVRDTGAGLLNLEAAFLATLAASPTSISFGFGFVNPNLTRRLRITNYSTQSQRLTLAVTPGEPGAAPVLSEEKLSLASGASAEVTVTFKANFLEFREYDGFIRIQGSDGAPEIRVPYWYAVGDTIPKHIHVVSPLTPTLVGPAILFRVTDGAGYASPNFSPRVTSLSGSAKVRGVYFDSGAARTSWAAYVDLSEAAGPYLFRIEAGEVSRIVTVMKH